MKPVLVKCKCGYPREMGKPCTACDEGHVKPSHVVCDTSANRALLTPVSVRLYNTLAEAQALIRERIAVVGDRRAQGIYSEIERVLRDAKQLASGIMPPEVLRVTEDDNSVTVEILATPVSQALRSVGPCIPPTRPPYPKPKGGQ